MESLKIDTLNETLVSAVSSMAATDVLIEMLAEILSNQIGIDKEQLLAEFNEKKNKRIDEIVDSMQKYI